MRIACDGCGKVYVADDRLAGRSFRMRCKRCGSVFVVEPGRAVEPAPPAPAADGPAAEEAPAFTFGDTGAGGTPAAPPAAAGPGDPGDSGGARAEGRASHHRPPAVAADPDTAFADFSRELQDFCEELERE
jgi:predicted Zn finger-like uncharacterized protein